MVETSLANLFKFGGTEIIGSSCKPTAQQQHRQVNIGQNKVSLESYPFARTLTGNTYRWREDNVYYHYCGNINIPNM